MDLRLASALKVAADVVGTDPFRPVDLVGGQAERSHSVPGNVHIEGERSLNGVADEVGPHPLARCRYAGDFLNGPDLVIDRHRRHTEDVVRKQLREQIVIPEESTGAVSQVML